MAYFILLGPPGCGKGTQARRLSQSMGLIQVSTGDILRQAIADKTKTGLQAAEVMERGDLVSDEIVTALIAEKLENIGEQGVIFDGYPRTIPQAESLDQLLEKCGRAIDCALEMTVNEAILIERISGRFTCADCNEGYHDKFKPTKVDGQCDLCSGQEFKRRADDNAESVKQRLLEYHQKTTAIISYYQDRKLLRRVDGMASMDQVYADLESIIKTYC